MSKDSLLLGDNDKCPICGGHGNCGDSYCNECCDCEDDQC